MNTDYGQVERLALRRAARNLGQARAGYIRAARSARAECSQREHFHHLGLLAAS